MTWGEINYVRDPEGTQYLEYSKRHTKARIGAEPRKIGAVNQKAFSIANNPHERNKISLIC